MHASPVHDSALHAGPACAPAVERASVVHGTARGFVLEPAAVCEVERAGSWHPGTALGGYADRVVVRFTVAVGETYQQAVPVARVRAPVPVLAEVTTAASRNRQAERRQEAADQP